jgi:hypothetical protein
MNELGRRLVSLKWLRSSWQRPEPLIGVDLFRSASPSRAELIHKPGKDKPLLRQIIRLLAEFGALPRYLLEQQGALSAISRHLAGLFPGRAREL